MQHHASFSSLLLLTLKEIRLERGIHQGYVAQIAGKTPSAWAKIESGQSPLTMDTFFGACSALTLQPSFVITLAERLVPVFNRHGWYFQSSQLGDEDELLPLILSYFASSGYESLKNRPFDRVSLMALGSVFSPLIDPTVVQYCCIPGAKEWIDNGAMPSTPAVTAEETIAHTPVTW